MLKKVIIILSLLCLIAVPGFCLQKSTGSGELTSSAIVYTGKCAISSLLVITDGTNDATVILYDNTAASGTKIAEFVISGADRQGGRNWVFPVYCYNGIYAEITGTGASCIVEYIY